MTLILPVCFDSIQRESIRLMEQVNMGSGKPCLSASINTSSSAQRSDLLQSFKIKQSNNYHPLILKEDAPPPFSLTGESARR